MPRSGINYVGKRTVARLTSHTRNLRIHDVSDIAVSSVISVVNLNQQGVPILPHIDIWSDITRDPFTIKFDSSMDN